MDPPTEHRIEPETKQPLGDVAVGTPDMATEQAQETGAGQPGQQPQAARNDKSPFAAPPPGPWTNWEQVKQVREALHKHRFLLLRRPKHLNAEEQAQVAAFLACPLPQIRLAHSFLWDWYELWKDEQGCRRTVDDAKVRYDAWRSNPAYLSEPACRRVLDKMTDAQFEHLSPFLRNSRWEATKNGAERAGRAFRHEQGPHFNLRTQESIGGALIVRANQTKAAALSPATQQAGRATRGRKQPSAAPE